MAKDHTQPATAETYQKTSRTKVRIHQRADYARATVHSILDAGYVVHLAFVHDGAPVVIPTFYVRDGESLLIHGSRKTRMFMALAQGMPLCASVTHLDGLVLARSWFHHSMNYRSVSVHGQAVEVTGDAERLQALRLVMERIAPGRADGSRPPNAQEMKATMVLRIPLDEAVAKVRTGGPNDDEADLDLPYWAGCVPIETRHMAPITSRTMRQKVAVPDAIAALASTG